MHIDLLVVELRAYAVRAMMNSQQQHKPQEMWNVDYTIYILDCD